MIIDNVDDSQDVINHWKYGTFNLPNWKILITTRSRPELFPPKTIYSLDLLDMQEAVRLFHDHYTAEKASDITKEILTIIDRHTLTIQILALNLNKLSNRGYRLSDLRDNLKNGILDFPDTSSPIPSSRSLVTGNIEVDRQNKNRKQACKINDLAQPLQILSCVHELKVSSLSSLF